MTITINGTSGVSSPGLTLTGPYNEGVVTIGNSTAAKTLSLATGTYQTCTLNASCTFTMPSVASGVSFILMLYTVAGGFTANFTGVKWPGGVAPVITTTASRVDILTFVCDGTYWYGASAQGYA